MTLLTHATATDTHITQPVVLPGSEILKDASDLEQMIEQIAMNLVDQPEAVRVESINGSQTMVLELTVAKADIGKIIGREGKTASAIRLLLAAASRRKNRRVLFKIIE